MALSRIWRLRSSRDFQQVRQHGQSLSSRLLILAWNPNDVARPRIGFVVSKRTARHAVQRNHIKRLLGQALQEALPYLPAGVDIVVTAKGQAATTNLYALKQDMRALLQRAKLLSPRSTI